MMVHLHLMPHSMFSRNVIEAVNDVFIMFAFYHMACFSDFPLNSESQFKMGYSFVANILLMISCNLYYGISKILIEYRKEKSLLAQRQIVQENLASFKRLDDMKKRVRRERRCIKRDVPRHYTDNEEAR